MRRKKPFFKQIPLKKKLVLLAILVLIYFLIVAGQYLYFQKLSGKSKEKTEMSTQTAQTIQTEKTETDGNDIQTVQNTENIPPAESVAVSESAEKGRCTIEMLEPLATQIMGEDTRLLEEQLYAYNTAHGISCSRATLLEAAVSMTRDNTTEFYIENEDGSLVTLYWNPYQRTTDAQSCIYTKEEILENAWMFSEGEPKQHGITAEEELAFYKRMEESITDTSTMTDTEGGMTNGNENQNSDAVLPESSDSQ